MKKLGLLLGVLVLGVVLVGCRGGGDNEIQTYLNENEATLVTIFGTLGLGEFELSTAGNDQLVATFELEDDTYQAMEAMGMFDSAAAAIEEFIVTMHTMNMRALAEVVEMETELDQVMIRIVVNFDEEELINLTFENE